MSAIYVNIISPRLNTNILLFHILKIIIIIIIIALITVVMIINQIIKIKFYIIILQVYYIG